MDSLHVRLLEHTARVLGEAEPEPEPPERIAAAEARLRRPLPPGYRRFLEEVGRVHLPLHIESVVTFGTGHWPRYFVPFGSDHGESIYGFDLRGPPGPELPIDRFDMESDDLDEEPGAPIPFETWLAGMLDAADAADATDAAGATDAADAADAPE